MLWNLPAAHAKQVELVGSGTDPAAQALHEAELFSGATWPAGQAEQAIDPVPLNVPLGHTEHTEAPPPLANEPAPQAWHALCALTEIIPAGHAEHVVFEATELWNLPAVQATHD